MWVGRGGGGEAGIEALLFFLLLWGEGGGEGVREGGEGREGEEVEEAKWPKEAPEEAEVMS